MRVSFTTFPLRCTLFTCLALLIPPFTADAQPEGFNYDEALVPDYQLPELLISNSGMPITTPEQWWETRRPEIMEAFLSQVYGRSPSRPDSMRFEIRSVDDQALGGTATRKQVRIHLGEGPAALSLDLLLYVPNDRDRPAPVVLGLNFNGNHTIHPDPGIELSRSFTGGDGEVVQASEQDRGSSRERWQVESAVRRGFGVATIYYEDIDPDFDDGFANGVHALYNDGGGATPAPDEWGSIAAWAWGLSRAMDYLETDDDIEEEQVAVMGHSRLGKAALWAGATDPRFNFVISNNSGEGGAAITRRRFGETIERINTSFPHWFADNFTRYNGREDDLPVDAHMLIALIAPRAVYVASAEDDLWADPRGEFLAALHAQPVYRLLAAGNLAVEAMPPVGRPVLSKVGYHIRTGGHDVTAYDWEQWMNWIEANGH